jgi:SAM-dependent methyltransferase
MHLLLWSFNRLKISRHLKLASSLIEIGELRFALDKCPLCSFPVIIKLGLSEHAIRCMRCGANPAAMSIGSTLKSVFQTLDSKRVYELSSRGPFFRFLSSSRCELTYSEFYDNIESGEFLDGVQCQDVQRLNFKDSSFDICTSTDVFEHVADDSRGFAELYRVLRPGGVAIFTVPITAQSHTVERARLSKGGVVHMEPPEYHADHIRGSEGVLCFRNYGRDVTMRLDSVGFQNTRICTDNVTKWWGHGRFVVVGHKL